MVCAIVHLDNCHGDNQFIYCVDSLQTGVLLDLIMVSLLPRVLWWLWRYLIIFLFHFKPQNYKSDICRAHFLYRCFKRVFMSRQNKICHFYYLMLLYFQLVKQSLSLCLLTTWKDALVHEPFAFLLSNRSLWFFAVIYWFWFDVALFIILFIKYFLVLASIVHDVQSEIHDF